MPTECVKILKSSGSLKFEYDNYFRIRYMQIEKSDSCRKAQWYIEIVHLREKLLSQYYDKRCFDITFLRIFAMFG